MDYDEAIHDYLDANYFYLKVTQLGDYIENCPSPVNNYQIVLISDDKRGFTYPMIMPWDKAADPGLLDIVKFIVRTEAAVNDMTAVRNGDVPLHLATNYDSYIESNLCNILSGMIEKLNLPLEEPCDPA